jgi:hypothetical protein
VAATGGEAALARVGSAALRGDGLEGGVVGTVAESVDPDGFRRVTTQQQDTREETVAGKVGWLRDWNGHVRTLQGRDLADARAVAAIDALLYAGGVLAINRGRSRLIGEDDTHERWVVRIMPLGTTPFDVHIDKATALPVSIVRATYEDKVRLTLSDWRPAGGIVVPFAVQETGGGNDSKNTFTLKEFTPSKKRVRPPFTRPKDGPVDVSFTSGASALAIPFNFENDHIMIDGRIGDGPPIWFMLDTGAETTIINRPRMAGFGLVPFGASTIEGGGNTTDFAYTKVPRLTFPGVAITNQRDGVIDLTGLEKIYGRAMGGILGYDFFSRFVVRVNYDTKTLDLLDPASFKYEGSGKTLSFIIEEGGLPHIASTITVAGRNAGIPADMVVDCGAADTINLCSPFVRANDLLQLARSKPAGTPNVMAGSEKEFFAQTSVRGWLMAVTLGPFTLQEIPGNLMVATTGGYASTDMSGTIGEGILKRFTTTYDYARGAIFLEPNAEFAKQFPGRKTFGATFLSDGPDYRVFKVTAVRKGSPAEAAGLQEDDIVAALDGKPAAEFRLADLRLALSTDGSQHTLTVKRGDDSVMVAVTVTLISLDDQ